MTHPNCPEYARLRGDLENILGNLAQVVTLQVELIRSGSLRNWKELDTQLELSVGEKERCLGALRQHVREHKCLSHDPF